jgi:hypothetical protein
MTGRLQILWLFVLAAPVACVAWTVTHEDVFKEVHHWCVRKSESCSRAYQRKFFYLFTCEYCFSHYVAGAAVLGTGFRLLLPDWRGAIIAWFSLVWVANLYMSLFGRLRLDIKRERVEIKAEELEVKREERVTELVESGEAAVIPAKVSGARQSAAAARPPVRPAHRA